MVQYITLEKQAVSRKKGNFYFRVYTPKEHSLFFLQMFAANYYVVNDDKYLRAIPFILS